MKTCFRRLRCRSIIALTLAALSTATNARADESVARIWNDQLLRAISKDTARPTVHARNLFHVSAAMYDTWAAYDDTATQFLHQEKLSAPDVEAARREAISYAAYRMIRHRFVFGFPGSTGPGGPGAFATLVDINNQMSLLGYNPNNLSTVGNSPAAVGNRIAQAVIDHGLTDGANEFNRYATAAGQFEPVNPRLTFEHPGTVMTDPNRWQPLHFLGNRVDQFGTPINESTQKHLTPFWGAVTPFAMTPADRSANGVYHDQGLPPGLNDRPNEARFKEDAMMVIRLSSYLDPNDGAMMDISPATRGNAPNAPFTESYDQVGYAVNPVTGQPYEPELVRRGDFFRVIAEFWADGPRSTAPPGHWNEIRSDVTDKMEQLGIPKRFGGRGSVVSDLEWDIKSMFALNGGLHDAAIAAWNHKGVYDSSRPISFIRYMGQLGQSSDPSGPSYHEDGLPLEPGLVEVITAATTAPGERHEHLAGSEGKIAIRSWQGAIDGVAPFDDPSEIAGVDWILAENWMPYQLISFVTPPFAGYVSGHSTYSRTGAEVLTLLTGSPYFPGGIFEYDIPMGSGLDFEYGPVADMQLQFATYYDASDQASLSRISGGIHPAADDFTGRRIGSIVGPAAWEFAQHLFGVPEPAGFVLGLIGVLGMQGFARRRK
ncbi:MAG: vanadium-dependent haloperoxidase [Planctomycetes bacterium]|nr:vanadium-dependent haloperoxidase [Planctomycetota bacterium]